MQYVMLLLLLPVMFYTLSYARYNWGHKNKKAAFGVVLLVAVSIILPVAITLLSR